MLYNPIAPIRLFAEMSNGRFDQLRNEVQELIQKLEKQAQEFITIPTLYQKRQAIAMSNQDFQTMKRSLSEMRRLIHIQPSLKNDSFA
jgi:hypothetical protein